MEFLLSPSLGSCLSSYMRVSSVLSCEYPMSPSTDNVDSRRVGSCPSGIGDRSSPLHDESFSIKVRRPSFIASLSACPLVEWTVWQVHQWAYCTLRAFGNSSPAVKLNEELDYVSFRRSHVPSQRSLRVDVALMSSSQDR